MKQHHHLGQTSYNFPNLSNTFYTKDPKIKNSYDMSDFSNYKNVKDRSVQHSKNNSFFRL